MEKQKNQKWLQEEIQRVHPDIYVDVSNIYKITRGEIKSGKLFDAICEVLNIEL